MDLSLQALIEAALQQGVWAALYIYLFFRMLRETAAREEKYQIMIDALNSNILKGIGDIQDRLDGMSMHEQQKEA